MIWESVRFVDWTPNRARLPRIRIGARDAAASALEETDERYPELHRQMLGVDALAKPGCVRRAAPHREVLASDGNLAAVDGAHADHIVGRREIDHASLVVEIDPARHAAMLREGAGVEHQVDPLADRELTPLMLPRHRLRPTLGPREGSTVGDLPNLFLPAH